MGVGAIDTRDVFFGSDGVTTPVVAAMTTVADSKSALSTLVSVLGCSNACSAVSNRSCADFGNTDFGLCTKLLTEFGTGNASTNLVSLEECALRDVTILPIFPNTVVLPAASAAFSASVDAAAIPDGFTPSALRKFNAPLRRNQFVPITAPIRPTRPNDTAPKIRPVEFVSVTVTMVGPVEFMEGEGKGVPERLILFEGCEKSPETETIIEIDGLVVNDRRVLVLVLELGDSVRPGKNERVRVCELLADTDIDKLADVLTDIDELTVPACVGENDGLLDTLILPESVMDASLDILWVVDKLRLFVTDELTVPACVGENDGLLDTLVLPEYVILWLTVTLRLIVTLRLTVTLRLYVADKLRVPENDSLTEELLEASDDIDIDVVPEALTDGLLEASVEPEALTDGLLEASVEPEALTDVVGCGVTVKLDVSDTLLDKDADVEPEALTDVVGCGVTVKLDVSDTLLDKDADVVIDIDADSEDDAVAEMLVLWDGTVVADPLILCDSDVVTLGLDEVVADMVELGLIDKDDDGELESTDPAPTATNAIFVD